MRNITDPQFQYTDALHTDIRHTWAKYCPKWAEVMRHPQLPLPIASVTVHHKPNTLIYTGSH